MRQQKKPVSQAELHPAWLLALLVAWLVAMWLTNGEGWLPALDK